MSVVFALRVAALDRIEHLYSGSERSIGSGGSEYSTGPSGSKYSTGSSGSEYSTGMMEAILMATI